MGSYSVYMHTNKVNGKKYIGITRQKPEKRWRYGHGYRSNLHFSNAIKKYGWNSFGHEILFDKLTKEDAEQKEIELIKEYKSNQTRFGYNIDNGGNSIGKHSEETKNKISKAIKLKNIGRQVTKETREKLSKANKGKNNSMYGKHHSDKTKEKISKANKEKSNSRARKIICVDTKEIFNTITECANCYKINKSTLKAWVSGQNPCTFKYQFMDYEGFLRLEKLMAS